MIDLYYAPTPNGWKISIMLEEAEMEYKVIPVNLGAGDQFKPEFLKISPNNRMPVIVDSDGPDGEDVSVFESGAILMYLGEKSGKFFPQSAKERIKVLEWLFWQIGGLGPMAGQVSHFVNYAPNFPGDHSYSEKRYKNEYDRLLGVMNNVLEEREFLAGDYSIADMASFPWVTAYKRYEVDLDSFINVRRWFDDIKSRPGVRRGMDVGKENRNFGKGISKESLKTMFGQTSKSINEEAEKKIKD
ncbi:MAG TPA: glutathione S-transferase N-terminal domain-containing protein [SAR86 cluster bacterium]|jgi:GST-like protein|nr:glutathione S-transferase N-terminal domain-containing protein [SAR86 cluster bacterium]|tara:strand:- start:18762 stop:19493 length:732 start_codon:yes stop_codon:yes gene_type:complete